MHSLPDNALNPLGLLAEASLANRKQQAASKSGDTPSERVGVASDVYFKPGELTAPISQSVTASRSNGMSRSNDAPPIAATVYRATKSAGDVELCQHGGGRCVVSNVRTLPPLFQRPLIFFLSFSRSHSKINPQFQKQIKLPTDRRPPRLRETRDPL